MTATTALTAQNTLGVKAVHPIPASFVKQQIEACIEDVGVDVIKTGMLASAETIEMLAEVVSRHDIPAVVIDPVMISTSGAELLPKEAIETLIRNLLPLVTLLTPNIPEANLILARHGVGEREIKSVADLEAVGRSLQALGPKWVLVKGGHRPFAKDLASTGDEVVVDVLVGPAEGDVVKVQSPWQDSTSTHGTGCTLACELELLLVTGLTSLGGRRTDDEQRLLRLASQRGWISLPPSGLPAATSRLVLGRRRSLEVATVR